MNRLDVYTAVHKMQRARLFDLTVEAGKTDPIDAVTTARLGQLREVASTCAASPGDPNVVYRALAAFTATYLEHLALEEGEALPALWEGRGSLATQAAAV